ncbi:short-chain dehydrogenase [Ktedonobacter sp. SOSP1-52]|uniref:SDR family oxidoreductase n=1 Tax=Ktedonobacter sp. SOSP1-52 TaxID=2778366 RepID=UPI0019168F3A|nr:SDR family oxidoreductase [Ktedonobacter sp. SOSP1-52]GHO65343.1 short-chain dehydrogenase [Ktedonobacter sp. SOSP1-52]
MDLGLKGKVAIVLAASKGIGRASALELAREGASVVIGSRDQEALTRTAQEIEAVSKSRVLPVPTDVTRLEDIRNIVATTVRELGRLDIVVNNAGGPKPGTFEMLDEEQWVAAFELNLLSTVRLVREVVPHLRKAGEGRIINIVSTSVKQPIDGLVLSNAVRSGVVGLAKTLSVELAEDNITVNNVCPGRILTDRVRQVYRIEERISAGMSEEEALASVARDIPMKRLGDPAEMGAMVTFLASRQAAYITGTTIQVDGGLVRSLL